MVAGEREERDRERESDKDIHTYIHTCIHRERNEGRDKSIK